MKDMQTLIGCALLILLHNEDKVRERSRGQCDAPSNLVIAFSQAYTHARTHARVT